MASLSRRGRLSCLTAVAIALVAGCGGSSDEASALQSPPPASSAEPAAAPAPSTSYDLTARLATLPSAFSALSLPAAPVVTRSMEVDTETELHAALSTSGADISVLPKAGGGCYLGSYTAGASDQRIRFRADACLVASTGTTFTQASSLTVSGRRIHLSGPGGVTGGSFYLNAAAQDIRVDGGMIISTKRDSVDPNMDQIHLSGTRVLMQGVSITSRTYCGYSARATDMVIVNSSLVSLGGVQSCLRIVGGTRIVVMDNRLLNPTHHNFRVHSASTTAPSDLVYFGSNQSEVGGVMSNNSAGNPDPQALRTWYVDNRLYGGTFQIGASPQNIAPVVSGNSLLSGPPPAWQTQ